MTITSDHTSTTTPGTSTATAPIAAGSDHYALAGVPWISADIDGTEGTDPDTLVASAKAYLGALNKLMVRRARGTPEAMVIGGQRVLSTDTI